MPIIIVLTTTTTTITLVVIIINNEGLVWQYYKFFWISINSVWIKIQKRQNLIQGAHIKCIDKFNMISTTTEVPATDDKNHT